MAFGNALRDYPDTKYAEEMEFLTIKAQYLYARNSAEYRQEERYAQAVTFADQFSEKYVNSKFSKDAADYRKDSERGIAHAKSYLAALQAEGKLAKKIAKDSTRSAGQQQSITDKQNQKSPQ